MNSVPYFEFMESADGINLSIYMKSMKLGEIPKIKKKSKYSILSMQYINFYFWELQLNHHSIIILCATIFVGIGGREPLVCKFPPCVNVLRYIIGQCGRESHLISLEHQFILSISSIYCKTVVLWTLY